MRKLVSILSLIALIFVTSTVVAAARPATAEVSFSMAFDNSNKFNGTPSKTPLNVGSTLSLASLGTFQSEHPFAFWVINGIVRDDLGETDSIRVQTKLDVKVILRPANQHAVVFADSNGKMISLEYVSEGESVLSLAPNVDGYDKPGLVVNSSNPWKSLEGAETLDNITSSRVYILQYAPSTVDVTINVTGGNATPASPKRNDLVTVVASDLANFKYWKDSTGKVLSFNPTYVFTATKNVTILAETVDNKAETNLVTMTEDLAIRSGYETYVGKFELLPGHTIVEWGFLLSKTTLEPLTFETENIIVAKSNIYNEASNEFVMSFSNLVFSNIRAYLVVDNGVSLVNIYSFDSLLVSDLIISEYVEASVGNTKVIELFNGTGKSVDLSKYTVNLYSNGSSTASNTEVLSGTLANGETYVIANASSVQSVLDIADITSPITFFNGDDAVALLKDGQVIDLIGVIGVDPGTAWVNGDVSTMDKTLVRKSTILNPNSLYTASEWEVLGTDVFTNLGKHSISAKHLTDKNSLFLDFNDLTLPSTIAEENDIILKSLGKYGSSISWVTDSEQLISQTGEVTLPSGSPETVVLTATITNGIYTKEKQFEILVGKTDTQRVQIAKESLSISTTITEAGNMGLPLSGQQNTVISWKSSNTSIISDNGIVVLPNNDYVDVTLTATIEFNGTTDTKSFIVRVVSDNVTNYTVSFDTSGGTTYPNQTVQSGQNATNPGTPTKSGYEFAGWYNSDLVTPFVFTTAITGNVTIYAKWNASAPVQNKTMVVTFTSKSWEASSAIDGGTSSSANWTSGKDGLSLIQNQGIQVTTGASGANGTSPSISNIKSIEVLYATNASKGIGTIVVTIGSTTYQTFTVSTTGGVTPRSAGIISIPNITGEIKITVNCTTNSIYIYGINIVYSE